MLLLGILYLYRVLLKSTIGDEGHLYKEIVIIIIIIIIIIVIIVIIIIINDNDNLYFL